MLTAHPWPLADYAVPRIEPLSSNLVAAAFELMKIVPARYMLQLASERGFLKKDGLILESTSGSFGLALSLISVSRGYQVRLISDPVIDARFRQQLRLLGTEVEIVLPSKNGNAQVRRLDRLHELLAENAEAYWPNQYGNPWQVDSYQSVSDHLRHALPHTSTIIGSVGTGGSMTGLVRRWREAEPGIRAVAVDTPGSVLFGQQAAPHDLRGLGNSLIPSNLQHDLFDLISWVPADVAYQMTRRLYAQHGLYMGPTSGAVIAVAKWYAATYPEESVLCILPDGGARYADTVYNDQWLATQPTNDHGTAPARIEEPQERQGVWTVLDWSRRTSWANSSPSSKHEPLITQRGKM